MSELKKKLKKEKVDKKETVDKKEQVDRKKGLISNLFSDIFKPTKVIDQTKLDNLNNMHLHSVDFFSFNKYECWAKCVKVYDGDTCTVIFYHNNKPIKYNIRLLGIDTAELKSKDKEEIVHAQCARDRLSGMIYEKLIYLECGKFDKYGRLLGKIYNNDKKGICYNDLLLDEGFAYKYIGGKRQPFKKWHKGENVSDENNLEDIYDNDDTL